MDYYFFHKSIVYERIAKLETRTEYTISEKNQNNHCTLNKYNNFIELARDLGPLNSLSPELQYLSSVCNSLFPEHACSNCC
jgi:hypothetical protein